MPTTYHKVMRRVVYAEPDGTIHKWKAGKVISSDDFPINTEDAAEGQISVVDQGVPLVDATLEEYQAQNGLRRWPFDF